MIELRLDLKSWVFRVLGREKRQKTLLFKKIELKLFIIPSKYVGAYIISYL